MVLEFILIALITGWIRGGGLRRLTDLTIESWYLVIVSFIIQSSLPFLSSLGLLGFRYPLLVVSYMILIYALIRNKETIGFLVAAIGTTLNFIVILFNGGMPVDTDGLGSEAVARLASGADGIHVLLGPTTRLSILADIVPYPLPAPFGGTASIGDILLGLGIFLIIQTNMVYYGKHRK